MRNPTLLFMKHPSFFIWCRGQQWFHRTQHAGIYRTSQFVLKGVTGQRCMILKGCYRIEHPILVIA